MSSDFGLIAPAVAGDTRVCVYDRAGRGWSESAPTAPHGIQIATDLHTLLQRAQVPGPYVLAGHSFGGLYVQTFAALYPNEVAGMVLIDSTAPDADASGYAVRPYVMDRVFALVSAVGPAGSRAPVRRHRPRLPQHHPRVRRRGGCSEAGGIPHGLRQQAAVRSDGRQRKRCRVVHGAGAAGQVVDQQRPPRRRRCQPPSAGRRPRRRRRHHASDSRRGLICPEWGAPRQVMPVTPARNGAGGRRASC